MVRFHKILGMGFQIIFSKLIEFELNIFDI